MTADGGTMQGLSLLLVLLISDTTGQTKLGGTSLSVSKEGASQADEMVKVLTEDPYLNLDLEEVKKKISGFAGDGAFICGNQPFKERLQFLLDKDLNFRWDLLHLVNRAYISARSLVTTLTADESPTDHPIRCYSVSDLMDAVQDTSKKWRTGHDYTNMVLSGLADFKRPKVWSNTRMVNYEFEQLLRFLECSKYWDLPEWVITMAKIYLPVTFVMKVILSKVQDTKVKHEYVCRVFGGEQPTG